MTSVVSVNGSDNVGKSTQLRWLATAIPDVSLGGTIDRWHPRWTEVAAGDFARWWFQDASTADHVRLVFDSHAARRAQATGQVLLEDRGWPMLVAVCAATSAMKDNLAPAAALAAVEQQVAGYPSTLTSGTHVLLRHSVEPDQEARLALAREPSVSSPWYSSYQHILATILQIQADRGDYAITVARGERPICEIQREIRRRLTDCGLTVRPLPATPLRRVWVLAGLSESGKSTVGELLRDEHGVTRLKIGYLLEVAAARAAVTDPYAAWDEPEQAERLVEELLRFAAASKAPVVSLESAHRFEATRHLRRVLGERCHLIYVQVDQARRAARSTEPEASLRQRDRVKVTRGTDRIAEIADWVIDNAGSLAALKLAVARMVWSADREHHAGGPTPPGRSGLEDWLTDTVMRLADPEVAAIVTTGSTNTSRWVPGWSDVDLLVVRDRYPMSWLRRAGAVPAAPDGAKVAVTYVATDEVRTGRVVPRLVHLLRQLPDEPGRVLYRRDGFEFPIPTPDDDDRASRDELALVVMRLRRLLSAAVPNVRAIHKHALLIMKIVLRASGIQTDAHERIISAFSSMFPEAAPLPPPECLIPAICDPPAIKALIAAACAVLDVVARIDQIVVRQVLPR